MAKRAQDQDAVGHAHKKANAPRDDDTSSPSATCEFCDHKFTTRELKSHQNHCKSKTVADKQPRCFKFCILNETLFEIILSFLSNQSLTKLQTITGDRYPNCEPELASCCCRCEEDNPAIQYGRCRECDSKRSLSEPKVAKEVAKEKYCLRNKDFKGVTRISIYGKYTRYDQKELEMRAIELYGSKQAWLRRIARKKKLAAEEQERISYLESLAPGLADYVERIQWQWCDQRALKEMSERFKNVKAASEQCGIRFEPRSNPCTDFITTGAGDIEDVIESLFLFAQKSYWQLIHEKQEEFSYETWLEMERECEEDAKMELCVEFLLDYQGFTLPRKWERCRARFEEVTASGEDPFIMDYYIYTGIGGPLDLQDNIDSNVASPAQN